MKHHWTFSLTGSFCALLSPISMAGMAPENDYGFESDAQIAATAVVQPKGSAQSAPSYAVSLSGPNRIAVKGKKIINAIYDASQLEVQTDSLTGQVFVFPKIQDSAALFITTEDKETHALTLLPQNVRSQEIVLNDESSKRIKASTYPQRVFQEAIETAPDIDNKVTRLIRALARNELLDGFHASNRCGKACLKTLSSDTLMGKVLIHTNTSSSTITLEEKFFYQKNVLAVAIEKPSLAPNELTRVYVVMKNENALISGGQE